MKYKPFRETQKEIIVLDTYVEMVWNGSNKAHYINLGYEYTNTGDKFTIHVDHLSPNSHFKLNVKCPICNEVRKKSRQDIEKTGHTLCNKCARIVDLRRMKFNRWTVIELVIGDRTNGAMWKCRCDCGNVNNVSGHFLVLGRANSCGCYQRDVVSALCGENSPNWKGGEIALICETCGEEYQAKRHEKDRSRFCSRTCLARWKSENMSGKNSPLWDDSIPEEERIIRRLYPEYREWVSRVMEKDQWICQGCGKHGGDLEAHHLYSYKHYPEYALLVEYGVVLCKPCHHDFHYRFMGGSAIRCIPADFDRWLYETS